MHCMLFVMTHSYMYLVSMMCMKLDQMTMSTHLRYMHYIQMHLYLIVLYLRHMMGMSLYH
jgi:hypothetical protein